MRLGQRAPIQIPLHPFKRKNQPLHLNRKSTARQAAEIAAVVLVWELAETGLTVAAATAAT